MCVIIKHGQMSRPQSTIVCNFVYVTALKFSLLTNSNIQRFCDLERSWTGNEERDRELFVLLGPSTYVNLIKVGPRHTVYPKLTLF